MNLFRLALLNIKGSAFRSVVVTLCAVLVAGFTLATTLLLRGNEASMQMALGRTPARISSWCRWVQDLKRALPS